MLMNASISESLPPIGLLVGGRQCTKRFCRTFKPTRLRPRTDRDQLFLNNVDCVKRVKVNNCDVRETGQGLWGM